LDEVERQKHRDEELHKEKKRLMQQDFNYDSAEEKRKKKKNP